MHVLRGDKLRDQRGFTHVTIADHTDTELKSFSFLLSVIVGLFLPSDYRPRKEED